MAYQNELAKIYDLIYQDKDYQVECDFVEEVFQNFSSKPVRTILDGGCGTGGHAIPLAERDYQVTGFDSSEGMIKRAKEKVRKANLSLNFEVMDLRQFDLSQMFDACLCMFAAMGYLTETEDILKSLRSIRRHLNRESLFLFDFWNGLAVLRTLPSVRVQVVEGEGKRVIRTAQPELDAFNHRCLVHYHLLVTRDNQIINEFEEDHLVRYFFPQEIAHYLEETGFAVLKICPFLDLEGKVDENAWNIAVIAKAV